ncbi:MAG: DegV family protein [Bacillota bacterium]
MIKITAESTCDLSKELLERLNIALAPLHILVDDKDYRDGVDIQPADIFRFVDEEGKSSSTAAVNVFEYESLFDQYAKEYDAVIHICISAEFSCCYQNACIAAERFDNVHIVDSRNLSTGSGHLVYEAARMALEGQSAQQILGELKDLIPKVDASFVIDRLDYLHRGGRCSGVEAFGAKVLSLKPSIEVVGGKMIVGKKYIGSFATCLDRYVKDRLSGNENVDLRRIFITHCMCSEQIVERVKNAVRRYADFKELYVTEAGCTISGHCGPNTLGILYLNQSAKKI